MLTTTILFRAKTQLNVRHESAIEFIRFVGILENFQNDLQRFTNYFYKKKTSECQIYDGTIFFSQAPFSSPKVKKSKTIKSVKVNGVKFNLEQIVNFEELDAKGIELYNKGNTSAISDLYFEYTIEINSNNCTEVFNYVEIFKRIIREYFNSMIDVIYSIESPDYNSFFTNEPVYNYNVITVGNICDNLLILSTISTDYTMPRYNMRIRINKIPKVLNIVSDNSNQNTSLVLSNNNAFYNGETISDDFMTEYEVYSFINSMYGVYYNGYKRYTIGDEYHAQSTANEFNEVIKGKYELLHPMMITENENGEPIITSAYESNYCSLNEYQTIEDTDLE